MSTKYTDEDLAAYLELFPWDGELAIDKEKTIEVVTSTTHFALFVLNRRSKELLSEVQDAMPSWVRRMMGWRSGT